MSSDESKFICVQVSEEINAGEYMRSVRYYTVLATTMEHRFEQTGELPLSSSFTSQYYFMISLEKLSTTDTSNRQRILAQIFFFLKSYRDLTSDFVKEEHEGPSPLFPELLTTKHLTRPGTG